jgi:flavin-dependent dehydrogenase
MALALAMAREGLSVAIVGPVSASWPNNYGVWLDEWDELGLPDDCLETVYESTRITISGEESIAIPRSYGKVNGNRFRQYMLEECAERGVHVLEGIVTGTEHDHDIAQTRMVFSNGQKLACRVPVVAAGHYSPLVKYQVVSLPVHTHIPIHAQTDRHRHTHTHTQAHTHKITH